MPAGIAASSSANKRKASAGERPIGRTRNRDRLWLNCFGTRGGGGGGGGSEKEDFATERPDGSEITRNNGRGEWKNRGGIEEKGWEKTMEIREEHYFLDLKRSSRGYRVIERGRREEETWWMRGKFLPSIHRFNFASNKKSLLQVTIVPLWCITKEETWQKFCSCFLSKELVSFHILCILERERNEYVEFWYLRDDVTRNCLPIF